MTGGRGATAVVVCAGVGAAYAAAMGMLAPFGTLMCLGIPPPPQTFSIHPLDFVQHGYTIMGSAVGTRRDTLEALEFVARGLVKPKVQWAELERLEELMEEVVSGKVRRRVVLRSFSPLWIERIPADDNVTTQQVQGKYVIDLDKA